MTRTSFEITEAARVSAAAAFLQEHPEFEGIASHRVQSERPRLASGRNYVNPVDLGEDGGLRASTGGRHNQRDNRPGNPIIRRYEPVGALSYARDPADIIIEQDEPKPVTDEEFFVSAATLSLKPQDQAILARIQEGLSVRAIATELGIAPSTVQAAKYRFRTAYALVYA